MAYFEIFVIFFLFVFFTRLNDSLLYSLLLFELCILYLVLVLMGYSTIVLDETAGLYCVYFICISAAETALMLSLFIAINRILALEFFLLDYV